MSNGSAGFKIGGVPFRIDITYAACDGAFLVLYGKMCAGRVCQGDWVRLRTTEGIELVGRILMICTDDGLYWGNVWRPEQRFRLWVEPPYRASLIRRGPAESTTMWNDKVAADWIEKTIAEKGAGAVYTFLPD